MHSQTPEMINKNKPATSEFVSSLSANAEQRRRLEGFQNPSLLFGTAVFAQMVAADLVRESLLAADDLLAVEEGADVDELQVAGVEETQGLFGAVAGSAAGLTPLLGGAALVGSLPGSSSNAAAVLGSGSGGSNNAGEVAQDPDSAQNSFFARNFSSLQNGGNPDTNGAGQVNPGQEADGAQTSAAAAQDQYASAGGGTPFAVPATPEPPVMAASQNQMPSSTPSPDGVQTQQASPVLAQASMADAAPQFNSAQEVPLNAGQIASPVSSAALPDMQTAGVAAELLALV